MVIELELLPKWLPDSWMGHIKRHYLEESKTLKAKMHLRKKKAQEDGEEEIKIDDDSEFEFQAASMMKELNANKPSNEYKL